MGTEGYSEGSDDNNRDIDNDQDDSIEVSLYIKKNKTKFGLPDQST